MSFKILANNLDKMIRDNIFEDKDIVVFGANAPAYRIIEQLKAEDISVNAIIDNNIKNKGQEISDVEIHIPEEYCLPFRENLIILIYSKYYLEMAAQLEIFGYRKNKHFFVLNSEANYADIYNIEIFEEKMYEVYEGYEIYQEFEDEFAPCSRIFLCPINSFGDVYIFCRYLDSYLKKNSIDHYLVVFNSEVHASIGKIFGIKRSIIINVERVQKLSKFSLAISEKDNKFFIVHPYWSQLNILTNIDGYMGTTFDDHMKFSILGLSEESKASKPVFKASNDIEYYTDRYKLVKGKSFIISPYANSLPNLPSDFWIKLVEQLQNKDYKVYTISSNPVTEPIIEGSQGIIFPFEDTSMLLEYAGYYIGMRNGISEIISTINCKKTLLYVEKYYAFQSAKELYSIKKMGLSDDVIELEISANTSLDFILQEI